MQPTSDTVWQCPWKFFSTPSAKFPHILQDLARFCYEFQERSRLDQVATRQRPVPTSGKIRCSRSLNEKSPHIFECTFGRRPRPPLHPLPCNARLSTATHPRLSTSSRKSDSRNHRCPENRRPLAQAMFPCSQVLAP